MTDGSRARRPWILAALFYTAFAVVYTWPLPIRLSTALPSDLGDPALNSWILWWNAHAVPLTTRWWNGPMFWPATGTLAFSEVLLGISVIATPLQWLGVSPPAAYNIVFILSFALCALAAHALVHTLTGRHDAATVAGLIFGFNPFRMAHVAHLQMLAAYGMPLALFALHQYLRDRRPRWLWLFGGAWLVQALSNGYFLMFFPILIALWIFWFVRDRRTLGAIVAAWVIASIPLVPVLWKYLQVHTAYGLQRHFGEINAFSADMTAFLDASGRLALWPKLDAFHHPEGELFPGLIAAALVVIGVVRAVRSTPAPRPRSRIGIAFFVAALIPLAVALSTVVFGPWSIVRHRRTLISVGVFTKPFSIAVLLAVIGLSFDRRLAAAYRRRSTIAFYVLAAAVSYLLAFGPQPHFLDRQILYGAPYSWLMLVPGFDSVRVPARFAMVALVGVAAAAGVAFARLTSGLGSRTRAIVSTAICAGVVAESWILIMPLTPLPSRVRSLESLDFFDAVVEVPLTEVESNTSAMYRSMFHRHPVVNGYSGYFPRHYDIAKDALETGELAVLDAISPSPLVVAIDDANDEGGRLLAALRSHPGAAPLGEEPGWHFFRLPPRPPAVPAGVKLPIASVSADRMERDAPKMIDGDMVSRWASGDKQMGGETVTIDLGSSRTITGLTTWIGKYAQDYPHGLQIDVSNDDSSWTTAWKGRGVGLAVAGAERDFRTMPLTVAFTADARWIRLVQTGSDRVHHWSIAELAVFGKDR